MTMTVAVVVTTGIAMTMSVGRHVHYLFLKLGNVLEESVNV